MEAGGSASWFGSLSRTQTALLFPGTCSLIITKDYTEECGWLSANVTPLPEARNANWVVIEEKHHFCSGAIAHSFFRPIKSSLLNLKNMHQGWVTYLYKRLEVGNVETGMI